MVRRQFAATCCYCSHQNYYPGSCYTGATNSAPLPEALKSVGKGDDGNQFVYSDTTWSFNLKTPSFSGAGTLRGQGGN